MQIRYYLLVPYKGTKNSMKYDRREGLGKFISNSLYVSSKEIEKNVFEGSIKGIHCKVKFDDKNNVFVSNYCIKCGNEFFYLYKRGKPHTVCEDCVVNKFPEIIGEIEINGKVFIKYSNGIIRPK